jgi:4'-phosphopantetheinyl transferase
LIANPPKKVLRMLPKNQYPRPGVDEAHLFCAAFGECTTGFTAAWSILSAEERSRAKAFIAGPVGERYVLSHAFLRNVLSAFVGEEPSRIALERLPGGKPVLADAARHELWFNLSHCTTHVVIAVAGTPNVGVDVECVHDGLDSLGIARRFFSPAEFHRLATRSPGQVEDVFLRLWTCKEAFLKAIGVGLRYGLDRVIVSENGENDVTLAEVPSDHGPPEAWSMRTVALALGCHGALAVNAPSVRVMEHAPSWH